MSLILGIDTSTAVSVGLCDDEKILVSLHESGSQHVEKLTPLVEQALAQIGASYRDLTAVACGLGPGPFTGLRVGIASAHVTAATLGIPIRGLCSLDALAASAQLAGEYIAAADARRKELYWAHYRDGIRQGEAQVCKPAELPDLPIVGPGVALYADVLGARARTDLANPVDAGMLALLSLTCDEGTLEPMYLRKPDAVEPGARKSALVGKHEQAPR
ncbi:MAG: tRNA (adenosine(37)-N6)-threonylcarbamoyltransferase complex dimerization subunit type 1 TsaB [Propionibacteriaceae bacterium]